MNTSKTYDFKNETGETLHISFEPIGDKYSIRSGESFQFKIEILEGNLNEELDNILEIIFFSRSIVIQLKYLFPADIKWKYAFYLSGQKKSEASF